MPMKVFCDVLPKPLAVDAIEVEIPDLCPNPKCGADLTAEGAIIEKAFTLTTQPCNPDPTSTDSLDYPESMETWPESQHVIGYECAECHYNLAGEGGL